MMSENNRVLLEYCREMKKLSIKLLRVINTECIDCMERNGSCFNECPINGMYKIAIELAKRGDIIE